MGEEKKRNKKPKLEGEESTEPNKAFQRWGGERKQIDEYVF